MNTDKDTQTTTMLDHLTAEVKRLENLRENRDAARNDLHETLIRHISQRSASPVDIARAAGVERNYIDQIRVRAGLPKLREMGWSSVSPEPARSAALAEIRPLAALYRELGSMVNESLAARNAMVVQLYRSGAMGPTALAKVIGVDRNHVMRMQRAAPGAVPRPRVKGQKAGRVAA